MIIMSKVKQRTIEDATGKTVTFTMHKLQNPMKEIRDTPYLYEIRINGSTDEEAFTRQEADELFNATIEQHKQGAQLAAEEQRGRRRSSGAGLFGGGLF